MKLRRLKLQNYCQHRGVNEWHFHGGTVGIIGNNGSGKTNLTRSIQDLTTGKFFKDKEKTITHGETVGSLECDFDAMDGTTLRIYRSLNKNEAQLSILDGEGNVVDTVANTITGTNEALRRYIPVDPDVLQHIIFAGQENITGLLFGKVAARQRLAQSFFGLERAREIEKTLGEVLSSLPSYDDSIGTMLSETSAQIDQLGTRDSQLSAMEFSTVLSQQDLAFHQGRISRHAFQANQVRRQQTLALQIAQIDQEIESLQVRLQREVASIEGFSVEELRAKVRSAQESTAVNQRIDTLEATVRSWQAAVEQASARQHTEAEIAGVVKDQADVNAEIGRVRGAIDAGEGVLEKLRNNEPANCPVCRHQVGPEDMPQYASQVEANRRLLVQLESANSDLLARHRELSGVLRELHADASAAQARISDAQQELGRLGPRREVASIQPLLDAIGLIEEGQREVASLESSIRLKQAERMPVARSIQELEAEGGVEEVTQEQCDESAAAIAAHNQAYIQQVQVQRERDQIRGQLNGLLAQEGRLTEAYRKQQRSQKTREFITKVRTIFHYTGAPRDVINSRFLSIQNRVNYYLELLSTPFRVRVQEGLNFVCQFPGKEIDSYELSGGEKVDLSVSFRLAACESFCSNAGFIVLDEPTTWLDENTKHEMVNVLDRLNELGRSNNFQFLVPTHERMLLDHFDQVIELS